MTEFFNRKSITSRRKELRNHLTRAEAIVWNKLKGCQLDGCKFRRQFSVGHYILDFYCPSLKLGVEVDGESHHTEEGQAHDQRRQSFLDKLGIAIIRVQNQDVYDNLEGVWELLRIKVRETKSRISAIDNAVPQLSNESPVPSHERRQSHSNGQ